MFTSWLRSPTKNIRILLSLLFTFSLFFLMFGLLAPWSSVGAAISDNLEADEPISLPEKVVPVDQVITVDRVMSPDRARMANIPVFSETFTYADNSQLTTVASDKWTGSSNATVLSGQVSLPTGETINMVDAVLNKRGTSTHIALDLINSADFSYKMTASGNHRGVFIRYDGRQIFVRTDRMDVASMIRSQTFNVSPTNGMVHLDLYLIDNKSQLFISDSTGIQASPEWENSYIYGDIDFRLTLGDGDSTYQSTFDNLNIRYTDDARPTADTPRAPVFVTSYLQSGIVGQSYKQLIRADGGTEPLTYTIESGSLPTGFTLTSNYANPSNDGSPEQWLGQIAGTPSITSTSQFTVQVKDANSYTTVMSYTLPVYTIAISFTDEFTGTSYYSDSNGMTNTNSISNLDSITQPSNVTGTNKGLIHDVGYALWVGSQGNSRVAGLYKNNRAIVQPNMSIEAGRPFRNDSSQYLHVGADIFSGTLKLLCRDNGSSIKAAYDGNQTVTVVSNQSNVRSDMGPRTDTFTVTKRATGDIGLGIYLQGTQSRVYIFSDSGDGVNGTQANELEDNSEFHGNCETSDFTLTLEEGEYDNVVVDSSNSIPEYYNPVQTDVEKMLIGFVGVPYKDILAGKIGKTPYTWALQSGSLPAGLSLASDGTLSGTPTTGGSYPVTFRVTDAQSYTADLSTTITIQTDNGPGTLLFADYFEMPNAKASERDAEHWDGALNYRNGKLRVAAHAKGNLKTAFSRTSNKSLEFKWSMRKGVARVAQTSIQNSRSPAADSRANCLGMEVEYDGVEHISLLWNNLCSKQETQRQDFLLNTFTETITVTIQVLGQQFALQVEDSQDVHVRGPFDAPKVQADAPLSWYVAGNLPYGVHQFTTYQSGNDIFDNFTVRSGVWTISDTQSTLRKKEKLGELLFFDPLLSGDNRRACASCHKPDKGFADGMAKEMGIYGAPLARNTPGLANLALMKEFFWDGRVPNINDVSLHPIASTLEMNQPLTDVVTELKDNAVYNQKFEAIWPSDGVTQDHLGEALAVYVRTLMELGTPYDKYLYDPRPHRFPLSEAQDAGLILFTDKAKTGCTTCHSLMPVTKSDGQTYNNPLYKALGVPADAGGTTLDSDIGRETKTQQASDKNAFRVPQLRNLSRTGPYMHNGVYSTLEEVVEFYNKGGGVGLGLTVSNQDPEVRARNLNATEAQNLVTFLKEALSPEYANYVEVPESVPSGLIVGGQDPILMNSGAGIHGKITAPDGSPLSDVLVEAYQSGFNDTWTIAGRSFTTVTGEYTITNLVGGNFRIHILDPSGKHRPQYYNNVSAFADALSVMVTSSIKSGIDSQLALRANPQAEITGTASSWTDPQDGKLNVSAWRDSDFKIVRSVTCSANQTVSNVQLTVGSRTFAMSENPAIGGQYEVSLKVPGDLPDAGTQAISVSHNCNGSAQASASIGEVHVALHDPSGIITDTVTGQRIIGATVMLYRVPDWAPHNADGSNHYDSNTCESHHSRQNGTWSQEAPTDLGVLVDPIANSDIFSPTINPQITGNDGRYAWDVATGCWYVVVQAEGYETKVSSVVGVPPEVTDLHMLLQPHPTQTPTSTPTQTPTSTPTQTPTQTPTPTPTHTNTPIPDTGEPAQTNTPIPATATHTNTPTVTPIVTQTATSIVTQTATPIATLSPTTSSTPTNGPSATPTASSTPTNGPSVTPTASSTPTNDPSVTPTATITTTPFESTGLVDANGGQVSASKVTVDFSAGVVDKRIHIQIAELEQPTTQTGDLSFAGTSFDVSAMDEKGNPVTQFSQPFTMMVTYQDSEWQAGGVVDEHLLNLYWWDGKQWQAILPCENCVHDTENNKFTVQLDHLTEFAILGPSEQQWYLPIISR